MSEEGIRREPAHEQAQRAVIGALLIRPSEFHSLQLEISDLTLPDCRRAFEAITELWDEGITPDALSIVDWTEANRGRTLDLGEIAHLSSFSSLAWETPRSAAIVRDAAQDRQVRLIAEGLMKSDRRGSKLLAEAMTAFNKIGDTRKKGAVLLTDAVAAILTEADRRQKGDTGSQILTGVPAIDDHQLLDRGGVLTIAGATSMGKSAWVQYLEELWATQGERILHFSTETQTPRVARRFLAKAGGLNSRDFGYGKDNSETWRAMTLGAQKIHGHSIWIDDESDRAPDMAKAIRRHRQQDGITIVVVDHLQECIENEDPRNEMNRLIASLRSACREEPKIALVFISQLTRGLDNRPDRKPRLSDLKESGSIENASDGIHFVFREYYYREQVPMYKEASPGEMLINKAKTRDGPTGWFGVSWDHSRGQVRGLLAGDFDE
ncbi:hypothetical protein LCGC14_0258460 [marine sediment metagenome]|uniref:DNA 5'-3' helicase n=1 Tax=marine sediment metagenome TaxID=412755 RepID=A0A0F9WMR0_9ZZZZ